MKSTSRTNQVSLQGIATGTGLLLAFAVGLATSGFVFSANAGEQKPAIITFDAPGATHGCMQGTHGIAISPQGTITGTFDSNGNHGFLRARDGTFITFDAPGAGTGPFHGTYAFSINPAETITGFYVDASLLAHGYVRASDGAITTFDAPGAGTGPNQGTFAANINPAGAIAGYYLDASNASESTELACQLLLPRFGAPFFLSLFRSELICARRPRLARN
jgi:hypothetical protein